MQIHGDCSVPYLSQNILDGEFTESISYNHGQKCWEGSFMLQITPLPLFNVGFSRGKNGDFSYLKNSNIKYGGGGHKSMIFPKYISQ